MSDFKIHLPTTPDADIKAAVEAMVKSGEVFRYEVANRTLYMPNEHK